MFDEVQGPRRECGDLVAGGFAVLGLRDVDWLRDIIRAFGGTIPETHLKVRNDRNSWECLLTDAEAEKRECDSTLERVHAVAEQIDLEIAQGSCRIREAGKRYNVEILAMLMKSDPQANLIGSVLGGASRANHKS